MKQEGFVTKKSVKDAKDTNERDIFCWDREIKRSYSFVGPIGGIFLNFPRIVSRTAIMYPICSSGSRASGSYRWLIVDSHVIDPTWATINQFLSYIKGQNSQFFRRNYGSSVPPLGLNWHVDAKPTSSYPSSHQSGALSFFLCREKWRTRAIFFFFLSTYVFWRQVAAGSWPRMLTIFSGEKVRRIIGVYRKIRIFMEYFHLTIKPWTRVWSRVYLRI